MLSHHCSAFLKWSNTEYNDPKHLVKASIKKLNGTAVVLWIECFVSSLAASFKTIEEIFNKRDSLPEFSELLLLGRMGSFWPLILKTWRLDQSPSKGDFLKGCRLLRVFTFRGDAMAGLRSDTALSTFHTMARNLSSNFDHLFLQLAKISLEYDLKDRFKTGLDISYFYSSQGSGGLYLLWCYENHLRDQSGKRQPLLSWREFDEPSSGAAKFSLEHVAAVGNEMSDTHVEWNQGEVKPFREVALNRLGNLVIDSISSNASTGKKYFHRKLKSLSTDSIYLSQGELSVFLKDRDVLVWDVNAIRSRHAHLKAFALERWNPAKWHTLI